MAIIGNFGGGATPTFAGGSAGNILIKQSAVDYDVAWTAPASSAVQDSPVPISSGAVYTILGNLYTILESI